jgi:predicted transcriptional regulator
MRIFVIGIGMYLLGLGMGYWITDTHNHKQFKRRIIIERDNMTQQLLTKVAKIRSIADEKIERTIKAKILAMETREKMNKAGN